MELKKLSIKNFIGDLPRIINAAFADIETAFNKIYHEGYLGAEDVNVKCLSLEVGTKGISSKADVVVETAQKKVSLLDLERRLRVLEDIHNISDSPVLTKKKLQ